MIIEVIPKWLAFLFPWSSVVIESSGPCTPLSSVLPYLGLEWVFITSTSIGSLFSSESDFSFFYHVAHTFFFSSFLPMFLNSYFFSSVGWFFRTSIWSKLPKEIDTAFTVLGLSSSFMTRIFLSKNSCSKFFNMKQSWVEWETNWCYRQYSEWFLIPNSSSLLLASGLILSCLSSS